MQYHFQNKEFKISRYPKTSLNSLQAWNAADELMLSYLVDNKLLSPKLAIYHDRFGFLACVLADINPISVILYNSQRSALLQNLSQNNIDIEKTKTAFPLDQLNESLELALVKIPKSADLFELYLQNITSNLQEKATVIASFMTKYFSKQTLEIAHKYFEDVSQSKAKKKARLLILKKARALSKTNLIHEIKLDDKKSFKQYYGVFSAKNIDYASQFLLKHISISSTDQKIMDLGAGNGVIAWKISKLNPSSKINLVDDNWLALESAKLNMPQGDHYYHFTDNLLYLSNNSYDLVVSNPPFHFEFETNIEISLTLFKQVWKILKPRGRFQLVGNKHLNYKTHLEKIFAHVEIIAQNEKFIVYSCVK